MTTAADPQSAADLCDAAAQAALQQQQALGPCPQNDPVQTQAWQHQNDQLRHNISTLTNLSSSLAAQAVSAGLNAVWPALQGLTTVTASAQADIANIVSVSAALMTLASVISFGVAVAALVAAPNAAGVGSVVTAFNAMKAALAANAPAAANGG